MFVMSVFANPIGRRSKMTVKLKNDLAINLAGVNFQFQDSGRFTAGTYSFSESDLEKLYKFVQENFEIS